VADWIVKNWRVCILIAAIVAVVVLIMGIALGWAVGGTAGASAAALLAEAARRDQKTIAAKQEIESSTVRKLEVVDRNRITEERRIRAKNQETMRQANADARSKSPEDLRKDVLGDLDV